MPGAVITEDYIVKAKEPEVEVPEVSIGTYGFQKFKEHANRELFVQYETGASLTGAQIADQAQRLATVLLERYGVTQKDVAAFYSGNLLEFVIAQYGILAIGLPFTPITINCKSIEIMRQLSDSKATIIFTSKRNAHIIEEVYEQCKELLKVVIVLDGEDPNGKFVSLESLLKSTDHVHPALEKKIPYFDCDPKKAIFNIIYTSGSTGLPKGAAASHYGLLYNVIQTVNTPSVDYITRDTIMCGSFAFAHCSGQIFALNSIEAGAKMVLIEVPDQHTVLDSIQKYKINLLGVNGALGNYMTTDPEADKYDLSSLKQCFCGGVAFPAKVASALIQKYGFWFREIYGATEMQFISAQRRGEKWSSGNLGSPLPGVQIKIADLKTDAALPPGKHGEVLLKGPSRILGYMNRPEANKSAFTEDGWYRTGDIGYVTPEGNLFLVDRIKQMIKYLGYAVYPVECESILFMHKDVKECVVAPLPHPLYGELPRAYVVLHEGATVTEQELEQFVAERIADQKRLRGGIRFIDEIPQISVGKPNRTLFKNLCAEESAKIYKPAPISKVDGKHTAATKAAGNGIDINGNNITL